MHVLIAGPEDLPHLQAEILRSFGDTKLIELAPGCLGAEAIRIEATLPPVFLRQCLPEAKPVSAPSVQKWAELVLDELIHSGDLGESWRLQLGAAYGEARAGERRCELIERRLREMLRQKRRSLLRILSSSTAPFQSGESLVQVLLTSPESGYISLSPAPAPFHKRHWVSSFPMGEIAVAVDKAAPSRAFAKLVEAESRLGLTIRAGETCVDLGASPGSWSYVALHRGAVVTAVDRSPLREDLMNHPHLRFVRGDAFRYEPESPVDWLLCDVIAAPERSLELGRQWIQQRWCRRFVVTIKFKGSSEYARLDGIKADLAGRCEPCFLTRLCANRNEACMAGQLRLD